MKELFFGWITKGHYQLTFLDNIFAVIEILGVSFIIIIIYCFIKDKIEYLEEKKNGNSNNK